MQSSRNTRTTLYRLTPVAIAAFAALSSPAAGNHGGIDSMYPTPLANWDCRDRGNATPNVSGGFCRTDNAYTTFFVEFSISEPGYQTIASVMAFQFDPTDLDVWEDTTPSYSGSSETDIIFQQRNDIPGGAIGAAWCDDAYGTTCDQHYAAFVSNNPSAELACHEAGHSVGLTHPTEANPVQSAGDTTFGCMTNAPMPGTTLGAHNIQQINSHY